MSNEKLAKDEKRSADVVASIGGVVGTLRSIPAAIHRSVPDDRLTSALRQQQLRAAQEGARNVANAPVAEIGVTGLEGLHVASGMEVLSALGPLGIAASVLSALDIDCAPEGTQGKASLALDPSEQNDPASSNVPR